MPYSYNGKKKAQEMKQRKDLERHEKLKRQNVSDTGDKKLLCPSEGWLVFFEKNMNKIVNLV